MISERALPDKSDKELISAISDGDRDSFRIFAKRHTSMIYAVAFRMFMKNEDAEDITQEVLIKIWNKAHLWDDSSKAAVSTWIYRITYNTCIDKKRRQKKHIIELDENTPDTGKGTDHETKSRQTSEIISASLQKLPERQRIAIILCHYQELSMSEAAEIIGTSAKAVESLLSRAKRSLKQDLKKYKGVL
jgi:RNA polymerase sigma-70 factor (ECF subfamily)